MCFSSSVPKAPTPPAAPPPPLEMTKQIEPATPRTSSANYKRRGTGSLRTDLMVGTGNPNTPVNIATS